MQSRVNSYVFCVVSALRNFGLGLLHTKHLANGDQWTEGIAGKIETHGLTGAICFPNTVVGSVIGLHLRCASQLHSLQ